MDMTERAKKLLTGDICTEADLRDIITETGKTQQEIARKFGVSGAFIHDMLHGNRNIGEKLPRAMGWNRVVVFVKKEKNILNEMEDWATETAERISRNLGLNGGNNEHR